MGRFKGFLLPLVGVAILLGGFTPWPSPYFPPAEAQVGGARALPDTQRVPAQFHVFKLYQGQRLVASWGTSDTLSVPGWAGFEEIRWGKLLDDQVRFVDPVDQTKVGRLDMDNVPTGVTAAVAFQATSGTMYITGGQDVAVADGGTGASDASGARTALGLAIGTDVQAYDADLTDLADGSLSGSKVGSGIDAANITTGNLPIARVTSTDGSGSGLDADLLDGQNLVSGATTANSVAGRDASGRIQVADPSGATDAVSKQYVDANAGMSATWTWIGGCTSAGTACGSWDLDSYSAKEFLLAYAGGGDDTTEANWSVMPAVKGDEDTDPKNGFSGASGYRALVYIIHGYGILGTSTTNRAMMSNVVDAETCAWFANTASTNVLDGKRTGGSGTCYFGIWYR